MKKIFTLLSLSLITFISSSQVLGVYEFTGAPVCPNVSTTITAQPTNGTFSDFSSNSVTCVPTTDVYNNSDWSLTTIDLTKYYEFTITAGAGKVLNLDSLNFLSRISNSTVNWAVRSSLDSYATDVFTGDDDNLLDTNRNKFSANFSNISAVTFRFYAFGVDQAGRAWRVDDVTLKGTISSPTSSISEQEDMSFNIFPNPGTSNLIIKTKLPIDDLKVQIYTADGKRVFKKNFSNGALIDIDTEFFDSGLYLIEISSENKSSKYTWIKN